MATDRQLLGEFGEQRVVQECVCPHCKRNKTLARLPNNFKCADVICDFCGYLAQVKAARVRNIETIPDTVLGAAWRPQQDRMASAIYFPLFLVLMGAGRTDYSIFYLSADLQEPSMFQFINSFAGNVGSRTLRALSTPVTGSLAGSINPICTSTDAWSQ
jgi:type II restriction enzyme